MEYGYSGDFLNNESFINNIFDSLIRGAEASEKITLGIIGLVGIGMIYQSRYTSYLFIIFIVFLCIHFLNSIFKPVSPAIICPHCKTPLKPIKYICPDCNREI